MAQFEITPEKEKHVRHLVKSFREIDAAIEPFREQRKDLRNSYIEEGKLTNEEFSYVKKAYNAVKGKFDSDDLASFMEIVKKDMPGE
jgi:hypothetical protein